MSTNEALSDLQTLFKQREKEFLNDYFTFLRFQSISTDPAYKDQMISCANWLVNHLEKMGFTVETWPTTGHPTLFATYMKAGPNKPTLLIYNHYDVQPVDPVSEWKSPPFEPTIRDGEVFARGAQDNKGQCFYTLLALKLMLERDGSLPINIKLCIEGEEEIGSAGLASILESKAAALKADYLAVVDLGIPGPNRPAITLGIRGMVTMEVTAQGSSSDLHSGCSGGIVFNPIHALIQIFASARDKNGRITIPGFYDDVVVLSKEDREKISWTFDHDEYEKMFGAKASGGELEFSPHERAWVRPTFEINGISGGYTGTGFKTVIPAKATAKFSCRLVPNQSPEKIGPLVARYIEKNAPDGIKVEVKINPGGGRAVHSNPSSKVVKAFAKAFEKIYKKPCEYVYEGATIPIVAKLAVASQSELVLVGLGLADDQIHAPNEHFSLDRIQKGMQVICHAIEILGKN